MADKKVQLIAYGKADRDVRSKKHCGALPVLVRVVVPPEMGDRAPIDLVAVLDVKCEAKARTNMQCMLEEAMKFVIGKLNDKDRLAIVPVQASEQTGLMEMSSEGRNNAFAKVKSLAVNGDNKLDKALANAAKILDERKQGQNESAGFVILISGDDASIFRETIQINCPVHTFGFRDAHNIRAMHRIAKNHTGTYGILNDEQDRITEDFEACITKITSVVALNTQVDIMCNQPSMATLSTIESGIFSSNIEDDKRSGHIKVCTLQAGAVRNFIVYVDNVREDEYDDFPKHFTVRFRYHHASSRTEETLIDGQVFVVRKGVDGSKEEAAEIVRVEAVDIVDDILRKYDDKGKALVEAADELRERWLDLKDSEYGREASAACLISGLAAEMQEMEDSMRRCSGLSYMLSWKTCHALQHHNWAEKVSQQAPAPPQLSLPPKGKTALETFRAAGAHAKAGADHFGGGSRKRKYQRYTELEMIKQRLSYWSKVTYNLPPMHPDGADNYPDQITMVLQQASRESVEKAMFHDVFLATVHATGRISSISADCSCGSATENRRHLD